MRGMKSGTEDLVLLLDYLFVHRLTGIEGKLWRSAEAQEQRRSQS